MAPIQFRSRCFCYKVFWLLPQQIQQAQKEDAICCKLIKFCHKGWPAKSLVPDPVKPYIHVAAELSIQKSGNLQMSPTSTILGLVTWIKGAVCRYCLLRKAV